MYLLFAFGSRGLLLLMLLLLLLVLLESQALNLVAQWSGLHGKHVLKMITSPKWNFLSGEFQIFAQPGGRLKLQHVAAAIIQKGSRPKAGSNTCCCCVCNADAAAAAVRRRQQVDVEDMRQQLSLDMTI